MRFIKFPDTRLRLIDEKGCLTRDGVMFFWGIWERIGGADGASIADSVVSNFEDAGSSEVLSLLLRTIDDAAQAPAPLTPLESVVEQLMGEISSLREQIAALRTDVAGLQQGYQI
jgi:hypothetical protein